MNQIAKDLTYAIRSLRKSPGFALSALAIFTLGIGANTAVFSIVNAVLLKPLPFLHSESIVTVFHVPPPKSFPGMSIFAVSPANYLDWRKQNTVFESIAVVRGRVLQLTGVTRPRSIRATATEPDFFKVLGVQPAFGRTFTREECEPGHDDVLVLTTAFAAGQFGSAREAVGRTLELNGHTRRIVGVMPPEFEVKSWFPASTEALVPLAWTPKDAAVRGNHNLAVIARLRPGVTVKDAQAQMNVISERLAREYPEEDKGWGAVVSTLRDNLVGDVRPALLTLLGAVGFVLLIACANTANLVLARTVTRRKELAIRAALGAKTGQVIGPVLVETTLLSVAGGVLGLLFAHFGQRLIVNALADRMPRATEIQLDERVLAFTLAASLLTGLTAGMVACWRMLRIDLNDTLKQGIGKTDADSGGKRTRNILVVSEIALSLILLVGAGLMIRSLWALRGVDPGFVSSDVVVMSVPVPPSGGSASHRSRLYDELLPQIRNLPGVVSAAAIDTLPLAAGGSQQPIVIEGHPAEVFALQPTVAVRRTTPGYLQTMRIPLLAGRNLNDDDIAHDRRAILISQSMARQFWPGENPVGKHLRISFTPELLREVVGVVGDVKERGLDVLEPVAMLYEPVKATDDGNLFLAVRTKAAKNSIAPAVTRILKAINPALSVRDAGSMDQLVADSLSQHRFSMFLFAALAGLAFALAAVGIYSVLAYSVRTRLQEISIRMAMGAQVRDVLRLIILEGMKPTILGMVVGAFGAWALSGILARLVFGVSTTDPYTFGAVACLLAGVALVACLVPAYRATLVEPLQALRNE